MSHYSNYSSKKGRRCTCPRNRLDNLVLNQEDAISILRIVEHVAVDKPITDEDRQIALRLVRAQARVMGMLYERANKESGDPTPYPLT